MTQQAVIYGRISRDGRKTNGDGQFASNEVNNSLDKQEDACLEYCKRKEMDVKATFVDADVSGSTAISDRPGGRQLLEYLKHNSKDGDMNLVLFSIDRLGRDAGEILTYLKKLNKTGVDLHIIDMGGDMVSTQGNNGWLMLALRIVMSEWELSNTKKRYQDAVKNKMRNSERVCRCVFGWDNVPSGKFIVDRKGNKKEIYNIVENIEEQKWIKFMLDTRQTPDPKSQSEDKSVTSYTQIAHKLNDSGVCTKDGRPWTAMKVYKIMKSKHVEVKFDNES